MNYELNERWETAGISNDFFFGKVMQNPELCTRMLEIILNVEIRCIEYVELQKAMDIARDARGIRLDVYVEDEKDTVYNVEIQTRNTGELPKRSRYYQAIIDLNRIEKGMIYSDLKKSFVIFICTFDLFGRGRHVYTFENRCMEEPSLPLRDETVKLFLNAKGTADDVSPELKAFLDYVAGQKSEDPFVQRLDEEVHYIRSNEKWRRDFMKWQVEKLELLKEGREEGRIEGRAEGRAEARVEERSAVILHVLAAQKSVVNTAAILGYPLEEVILVARENGIQVEDMLQ